MAEDFQPSYWWNNSASGGSFDRSSSSQPITSPPPSSLSRRSAATTDAGGAAAAFSWSPTTETSESKPTIICDNQIDSSHTPGFNWSQTLPGKAECSFHSILRDHSPFSRLELGESSSTIPFKDGNSSSSSSSPSSSSSNMYSSSMLRGLVEPGSRFQRRPCFDNQKTTTDHDCYQSQMMAFHGVSINETQLQQPYPLWNNASAAAAGFYPSPLPPSRTQISESNSGCRKTGMGLGGDWEESRAPEQKKTRIEVPSATPAITVIRKENLRDRITALQQLVSPFGKTDTASVLQEAIEYIKYLHQQVSVLCAPYLKTGRPTLQNQSSDNKCVKAKVEEGRRADEVLRSRGLCLVPMESIYPADSESITTTSEFWTPIHGRTYWWRWQYHVESTREIRSNICSLNLAG